MEIDAFANRLRKNARHLGRWARREGLEAWRLYDRDLPDFPYAIDRYAENVHVQLFEGKREFTDHDVALHVEAVTQALGISSANVVTKMRRRQAGAAQYEKLAEQGRAFTVRERDLLFEVNLSSYLDTGLFLDHRETRREVGAAAAGKRVLNLFAYTGSFTVYAAHGGAARTVTVDMSRTYQDWTRRNLALNDCTDPGRHSLVTADVLVWLGEAVRAGERFEIIVLDPPSFSNSKRMRASFDVLRDHPELLKQTRSLLAPGGELYFSTNRQGFRLAPEVENDYQVEEITGRTVPLDFKRRQPHRCWKMG